MNKIILTSFFGIFVITATFASGANVVVTTKNYVDDTFQPKIPVQSMSLTLPKGFGELSLSNTLVSYPTTTAGAIGQYAILDDNVVSLYNNATGGNSWGDLPGMMPNSIPTTGIVRDLIDDRFNFVISFKQNKIPAHGYGTINGQNPYTNGDGQGKIGTYDWLNADVMGSGVVTRTSLDGTVGERKIFESNDLDNYHNSNLTANEWTIQDISIPTMGAVMSAIQNGTNTLIPAGTAGNVMTYTGTAGMVGSNAVVSAATYDNQGTLTNGSSIPNVTALETKQNKKVCVGWPDGTTTYDATHTDETCWLWHLPD